MNNEVTTRPKCPPRRDAKNCGPVHIAVNDKTPECTFAGEDTRPIVSTGRERQGLTPGG